MPLDGTRLGRYQLLHSVGSGGMGDVYLADDPGINRQVAIKVIRTGLVAASSHEASLFEREMRAVSRLDHPNILPLYDYGEVVEGDAKTVYMVMPYRPEGSLTGWLRKQDPEKTISYGSVAHFVMQAALALQHAHDHQIIHQDVKPSNFLVRERPDQPDKPDLLLADFGVARLTGGTSNTSQTIRGTPTYMAPEQWEGNPVPATDQYSLAVMAYELLTGRPPFEGGPSQMMYKHFSVIPDPPSKFNMRLPTGVDAVLLKALSKQPGDRYSSVRGFGDALQAALRQENQSTMVTPNQAAAGQQDDQAVYATLAITEDEARAGGIRALTLGGSQQISVEIPRGARDGQMIRVDRTDRRWQGALEPVTLMIRLSVRPSYSDLPPGAAGGLTPLILEEPATRFVTGNVSSGDPALFQQPTEKQGAITLPPVAPGQEDPLARRISPATGQYPAPVPGTSGASYPGYPQQGPDYAPALTNYGSPYPTQMQGSPSGANYPGYPPQGSGNYPGQSPQAGQRRPARIFFVSLLIFLLVLGSGSLIYYFASANKNQTVNNGNNVAATQQAGNGIATSIAQTVVASSANGVTQTAVTEQNNANGTATAQVQSQNNANGTATAQTNADAQAKATADAQANAKATANASTSVTATANAGATRPQLILNPDHFDAHNGCTSTTTNQYNCTVSLSMTPGSTTNVDWHVEGATALRSGGPLALSGLLQPSACTDGVTFNPPAGTLTSAQPNTTINISICATHCPQTFTLRFIGPNNEARDEWTC